MLEALTREAIQKRLDERMPGFFLYPTQKSRVSDSSYILMGYNGPMVKLPLCLKVRMGTHYCTHENIGKYYFVSLRTDYSMKLNDELLMNGVAHVERIVNDKLVLMRKKSNKRF